METARRNSNLAEESLPPSPRHCLTRLDTLMTNPNESAGFPLFRVLIYGFLLLAVIAVMLPNFGTARSATSKNACFENLKLIQAAKNKYESDHHLRPGDTVFLTNLVLVRPPQVFPECSAGGSYSPALIVSNRPTCSAEIHNQRGFEE